MIFFPFIKKPQYLLFLANVHVFELNFLKIKVFHALLDGLGPKNIDFCAANAHNS